MAIPKNLRCALCNSRRLIEVTNIEDGGRSFLCKDCGEGTELIRERIEDKASQERGS